MKKLYRNITVLAVMVIVMIMVLAGCGGNDSNATLEDFVSKNADFQDELDQTFAGENLDGTAEVKGNDIIMTVDIANVIGDIDLNDDTKELLADSYESVFKESEAHMSELIADIEEESGVSGVTLIIDIKYDDELIYEHTYTNTGE